MHYRGLLHVPVRHTDSIVESHGVKEITWTPNDTPVFSCINWMSLRILESLAPSEFWWNCNQACKIELTLSLHKLSVWLWCYHLLELPQYLKLPHHLLFENCNHLWIFSGHNQIININTHNNTGVALTPCVHGLLLCAHLVKPNCFMILSSRRFHAHGACWRPYKAL